VVLGLFCPQVGAQSLPDPTPKVFSIELGAGSPHGTLGSSLFYKKSSISIPLSFSLQKF